MVSEGTFPNLVILNFSDECFMFFMDWNQILWFLKLKKERNLIGLFEKGIVI